MPVTTKKFYASTLIKAAGCSAETFRAWRTRNGLFPETLGSGTWNKFSIIDMFVVWIVRDLTKRGIAAQCAVDAAMATAPILTALCDYAADEVDDDDNIEVVFLAVAYRIARKRVAFGLKLHAEQAPSVRLLEAEASISSAMTGGYSVLVDVTELMLVVGSILMEDVAFEGARGPTRSLGAWSKLHTQLSSDGGRSIANAIAGKRKTVRRG